jgi:hypothetical protein
MGRARPLVSQTTAEQQNVRNCGHSVGKFALFADKSLGILMNFAFFAVCA